MERGNWVGEEVRRRMGMMNMCDEKGGERRLGMRLESRLKGISGDSLETCNVRGYGASLRMILAIPTRGEYNFP